MQVNATDEAYRWRFKTRGAGIPPEQMPRIFDKFYRADNQPEAADGTGLGLAIAKTIVEAHRGTITVDSTPGVGATFTITLPRALPTRRVRAAVQTPALRRGASQARAAV